MSLDTEEVWKRLGTSLRRFVGRRVVDRQAAEDLFQEVFLRIHRKIGSVRSEERLAPWVYRVARNAIIDHHRRHGRESAAPPPEDVADEPSPGMDRDVADCLASMIDSLPERYREVLRLSEIDGVPHRDLAARLGLSVSGVKSRVQRGRDKLKDLFVACCRIEFDHRGRPIDCEAREDGKRCEEDGQC